MQLVKLIRHAIPNTVLRSEAVCEHILLADHSHELFVCHSRIAEDSSTMCWTCLKLRWVEFGRLLSRILSSRNTIALIQFIVVIFKGRRQVVVACKTELIVQDRNLFCFRAQRF